MMKGPNLDLYARLKQDFPGLKLIASGGVSSMEDLQHLKDLHLDGAIVGKAIYEGRIKLEELVAL
jgi:phosphoribosylformimino-5-aminoimidazole carboxamide ribotide isomerase